MNPFDLRPRGTRSVAMALTLRPSRGHRLWELDDGVTSLVRHAEAPNWCVAAATIQP